MITCARPFNCR